MSACVCGPEKADEKKWATVSGQDDYHLQCFGASYVMGALQKLRSLTLFDHALT